VTAKYVRFMALAALAALSASCGEFTRQGRAPVLVQIRSLEVARGDTPGEMGGVLWSDVLVLRTKPEPCTAENPCPTTFADIGEVTMELVLKNPGGAGTEPSNLNAVTINRYRIEYQRTDGRNRQGVDVPYGFDSAITFTVPSEGLVSHSFEVVRHVAKDEAPLRALVSNGEIISGIAVVTFYGRDQAGNEVTVSGNVGVNFGNFGDPAS
jgi:hypothetical protein